MGGKVKSRFAVPSSTWTAVLVGGWMASGRAASLSFLDFAAAGVEQAAARAVKRYSR